MVIQNPRSVANCQCADSQGRNNQESGTLWLPPSRAEGGKHSGEDPGWSKGPGFRKALFSLSTSGPRAPAAHFGSPPAHQGLTISLVLRPRLQQHRLQQHKLNREQREGWGWEKLSGSGRRRGERFFPGRQELKAPLPWPEEVLPSLAQVPSTQQPFCLRLWAMAPTQGGPRSQPVSKFLLSLLQIQEGPCPVVLEHWVGTGQAAESGRRMGRSLGVGPEASP